MSLSPQDRRTQLRMLAITRILDGRYLDHATVLRRRRRAKEFGGVELQRKLRMRAS